MRDETDPRSVHLRIRPRPKQVCLLWPRPLLGLSAVSGASPPLLEFVIKDGDGEIMML